MILLDGPLGTPLAARGVPTPAPAWSAAALDSHPAVVRALHAAYARAGATHHTAVTFRTTPEAVGAAAERLTRRAVALAREAVPPSHRVLGSLAPLGDCWTPGHAPSDASARHAAQVARLVRAGVDGLLVETFADAEEAVVATRAAAATGLPVWTALTPGYDGTLMTPAALAGAAEACAAAGAATVLANCLPARRAMDWLDELATVGVPWGVYANAGPREDGLWPDRPRAARDYADLAAGWIQAGCAVVGSCCGTGPAHIRALARRFFPRPPERG